jgi:hypothetical protein
MTTDYAPFAAMYTIEYDEECEHFIVTYDDTKELTYTENDGEEYKVNVEYDNRKDEEAKERKLNLMWIADIKKHYNWKPGEVLTFCIKQNTDNCFFVYGAWHTDDDGNRTASNTKFYDIGIDENGFVVKRYFQHYCINWNATALIPDATYFIRPSCVYNDSLVG